MSGACARGDGRPAAAAGAATKYQPNQPRLSAFARFGGQNEATMEQTAVAAAAGSANALPDIPLVDAVPGGPLSLLRSEPERLAALLAAATRRYGRLVLSLGDR